MTRMTYFSESFFKMLEPKIGHTGPYILLWGGFFTALSKEWIPLTAETWWAMGAACFYSFAINNLVAPWTDRNDGISKLKEQTQGLAMVQEQRRINLKLALDAEH